MAALLAVGVVLSVVLGGGQKDAAAVGIDVVSTSPAEIGAPLQAIAGSATWYRAPSSHDAAAGPRLRAMLGSHWRGTWVTVTRADIDTTVTVRLTDWCACGHGRVIDLDDDAFRKLAPLGRGVIPVTVSTVDGTLPATDTAP
jgi:rare lipoprotein A (peptidoglycan hydrolase)